MLLLARSNMMKMACLLLVGLAMLLVDPVAAQTRYEFRNCTAFDWNQQPGYLINDTTIRVSGACSCAPKQNESRSCPISASGDIPVAFRYNASRIVPNTFWNSPQGTEDFFHNLVLAAVNSSLEGQLWNSYVIAAIDTTQPLPSNTSGYIDFTPLLRCFEGSLSNCTGGSTDNIPIQACGPVLQNLSIANHAVYVSSGDYSIVEIPQANTSQYTDPFANQYSGASSNEATKAVQSLHTLVFVITMAILGCWTSTIV